MDAIEAILTTRAIRRFRPDPVSDDDIRTCLRAAQQAPSGGNVQPQHYVVVTDAAVRAELGRYYRLAFDRYEATLPNIDDASWQRTRAASRHLADHLGDVPVLVLFLQPLIAWGGSDADGPLDIGRLDASVYPAVQNFCVAARALGLGTTLTTVIRIRSAEVLALLGVPEGRFEIAALVPVGYPVGSFGVAPRKPAERATHWNGW
jgi:nitroreductase